MSSQNLLALLADGRFHSGQELGDSMGISRSAVWKHMQRLSDLGLELYSVKGQGYRLPGGLDLLDRWQFEQLLATDVVQTLDLCEVYDEVDSTNLLALQALKAGHDRTLYSAEFQSAGRGRRGRQWISPYAANLCFSIGWRFRCGVAALEGLSLAVGVAMRDALVKLGVEDVKLKWPNDLLWNDKKLAGILIELSGDASGDCEVVIGCGVNVHMSAAQLEQIDQPVISIDQIAPEPISRGQLLAAFVNEIVVLLQQFEERRFSAWQQRWIEANAFKDRKVRMLGGPSEVEGICKGIDASGALQLDVNGVLQSFHGGEVSVRVSHDS